MPDESEQEALSKIKAYLDAGHSFDAIREAGWASWIDHLEAKGYDLRIGQLALRHPENELPPHTTPVPTPRSARLTRAVKDKRVAIALLTVVLVAVVVIIAAVAMGGSEEGGVSGASSQLPTMTTVPPTLTNAEEEATVESGAATADAASSKLATARALPSSTPRPTNTPRPTVSPPYKLALISGNCVWPVAGSFAECEGFVENLTSQSMENIQAVIVYTDAAGTPLASDSALIDYNPMFPGQQSPWSVIGTYNPRYERWRVEFKEFFGGTILTRDDRP